MKKLYILGLSLISAGTFSAQAYLGKDFEDQDINSGGFTTQVVVGTADWFSQEYSNNNFAKMTNYSGGSNTASESWFVTPAVDLSGATSPILSFANSANFSGADLEVYVSTDYDGTSAPSTATWTALTGNLSAGAYDWVNSGEMALTATTASTYFGFKYTGSASDGKTWQIDSIFVAEAGTPFENTVVGTPPAPAVVKTITELQSNVSSADVSYYKDSTVTTTGIVTGINVYNGVRKGYYLQDGVGAWTGIYVYNPSSTCSRGDSVTVTGTVDEYQEVTQISNVTNTVIGSSLNDVAPTLIATYPTSYEEYESVLVKVVNANCTAGTDTYGNFQADDGSGYVKVTDALFAYTPSVGTAYNIAGIMQYYLYFKLAPRDANDVSVYTSVKENNAVLTNVYPNPSNGIVNIEVTENTELVVLDLLGNVVISRPLMNTLNTVDVSSLAAGNYILKVGSSVQQLMVK